MNDVIVPKYSPDDLGDSFDSDYVLPSLRKFISGLQFLMKERGVTDVRTIVGAKSFSELHKRIANTNTQSEE